MNTEEYFDMINKKVNECYEVANRARAIGIDPVAKVEIPIATSLAEKAIGLISTIYPQLNDKKIVDRIIELEKEHGQLNMAVPFKIAEEIAKEKYCRFSSLLEAIDAGIRVGFSYITLGVVSSPIEGFTGLKLGVTRDGKEYFKAYFSGPIRSAGTTASCVVLMLIDYLREIFGFAKYDASEEEVKRYVIENYDYHERVNNLQYLPTEEEIIFLAKNIPIEITGEASEDKEVSNYKDLERVETNFIRGGMCLIFSEGLAQKAQKGLRLLKGVKEKGFQTTGWDFLDEYIQLHKKREKGSGDTSPTYIKDLVAGRPIFSHPSRSGGFRFRYGRTRINGFSASAVHPATMAITGCFLSLGTQLKIEKPTKGCALGVCDEIDGPIVKLKNGSVRKLSDFEEAKKIYQDVIEIIYLGDILFTFGDVANRNYELIRPGYVEEWWELELKKKMGVKNLGFDKRKVSFEQAVEISKQYNLPLHPSYIYFWKEINYEDLLGLIDWLGSGNIVDGKIILPFSLKDKERFAKGKRALELIGCEHKVVFENVVIDEKDTKAIAINLGIDIINYKLSEEVSRIEKIIRENNGMGVLEIINKISKYKIKDKSGTFIGARMGRPEKAKLRKLVGSPHVLFPVGREGGRLRSVQAAYDIGYVEGEFPIYFCQKCGKDWIYQKCEVCGESCVRKNYCNICESVVGEECEEHGNMALIEFSKRKVDIRYYFDSARKLLGIRNEEVPLVKGVRGTTNADHSCESLAKGLLRAKYNLNVNKDGTIRYDMTEMPITHFKPKEIGTSIKKLRDLGYIRDIYGKELENDEQILELFPHDIILPSCPDSSDERADDVFKKAMDFVDEELEKLYKVDRFYKIKSKEDMIGALFACMAPHICTATVGRLIGFSRTQVFLASPYMHAAMRRDCDGDEAAIMLLMDLLLNFSRKFLPSHRGGTQDAPLVLNTKIKAGEVDDQILDFETGEYPLELYELAEQGKHSSEVKVENVKKRLKDGINPFENLHFTHDCFDINKTVVNTAYKSLPTMQEKVNLNMVLGEKIRALDIADFSRLIIERHFIRDIRGNLRKFSMQEFRCVNCNSKFRRPPLVGKCTSCGGRLIFTISEGSILKYMQPALELARKYKASSYLLESLELTDGYIKSIFGREKEKQENISKWF
ncbi:MAG: DNA polymerase II large subunit [Candidatus Pacearchaeota archaeon]|nr:DNA polymerase II large subunit [Candidatus Pacearchaeota archaeon]